MASFSKPTFRKDPMSAGLRLVIGQLRFLERPAEHRFPTLPPRAWRRGAISSRRVTYPRPGAVSRARNFVQDRSGGSDI